MLIFLNWETLFLHEFASLLLSITNHCSYTLYFSFYIFLNKLIILIVPSFEVLFLL